MSWHDEFEAIEIKKLAQTSLLTKQDTEPKDGFEPENHGRYSFQPMSGTQNDSGDSEVTDDAGYSGGFISEVDLESDDLTGTLGKETSLDTFRQMVKAGNCSSIATFNVDVGLDQVQKYSSDDSVGLKKDLRFSTIDKKYDLFYFDFSKTKRSDIQYCLPNALAASKPLSAGFVTGVSSSDLDNLGFSKSLSLGDSNTFFLRKNDLSKISNVKVLSGTDSKAEFLCDVADTLEDKIAGLQPYHSLKYGAGLIFPYSKPQDVVYHMGSVSFPIDIIFVGSSGKIKKIAKNISPGTQGTYGAADVSVVLEIAGGASDILGLDIGDTVKCAKPSQDTIERFGKMSGADTKSLYVKIASFTRKISFGEFDVLNMSTAAITTTELIKSASLATAPASKKSIAVYCFDALLTSEMGLISLSSDFSLPVGSFISANLRCDIPINKSAALSDFLATRSFTPPEVRRAFIMLRDDLSSGKQVVIATSLTGNLDKLKSLVLKRAAEEVIFDDKLHSIEIISMPTSNIIAHNAELLSRFNAGSISLKVIAIDKSAGAPIPDEIKEQASKVVDILGEVKESIDDLAVAFKNNSDQYDKQRGNVALVENSRDAYRASCQRISKKIVAMLLGVKKAIKIMGEIKDISSVDEKVDALSLSCKEFVTVAEDTFALEKNIKEPTFVDELIEATGKIEKAIEDIDNNLKNFSDYILKDILNKKVLSR
jgi:hypothetical protein